VEWQKRGVRTNTRGANRRGGVFAKRGTLLASISKKTKECNNAKYKGEEVLETTKEKLKNSQSSIAGATELPWEKENTEKETGRGVLLN